jgi:UDP-N-acetylmuramoyl-tripeptide--D-alanyl-D-alanine ligase
MKSLFKKIIVSILTLESKILLKRHRPFIIAITGSVGKTSTKDAIYTVLRQNFSARKSQKSFNSDIGVPLTVLGLPNAWNNPFFWLKNIVDGFFIAFFSREYPDYLVLETGVDRPGDMAKLTSWLKPNLVVLTRLPDIPVHVEFFSSPEAVIREKMKLVEALVPDGVVIFNADDQLIQREMSGVRHQAIGYGLYAKTHFNAVGDQIYYVDNHPAGVKFVVEHLGLSEEVKVPDSVGLPLVYVYLAAIAVGVQCGVDLKTAAASLKQHESAPGRMRVLKGIKGTTILDDTYNSSPIASEQALATLREIKFAKRKIAVLGDMLELGKYSAEQHEKIGIEAAKTVDALFTLGIRSRKTAEAALESGLTEKMIFQYEDPLKLGRELQVFMQAGDVILVKGSQGMRAEKVVEEVMLEPDQAKWLLVRQDNEWQVR